MWLVALLHELQAALSNSVCCVALVSFQGALPTYGKGGSLTRLGGTFVVSRSEEGGAQIVYSFVDKETGVHAPTEEVVEAIHKAAAGKAA